MVARIPAQISKIPPRLPVASARTKRFTSSANVESCRIRRNRYIAFAPAYSQSRANATMDGALATPLFLITSIQPLYFHAITHSFAQRRAAIPFTPKSLRTLSIVTGVYLQTVSHDRFLRVQTPQLLFLHRLAASFLSLFTVFCSRFLCFQSFAASFPETPEVGVSVKSPGSSAATWTRRAHPTIIAISSRVQVHG